MKTNHNNPERDLLLQQTPLITIRLLCENGFPECKQITKQLLRLRKANPKLFDSMLLRLERARFQQQQENKPAEEIDTGLSSFTDVATSSRIKDYYVRNIIKLPTVANDSHFNKSFRRLLDKAYSLDYKKKNAVVKTTTRL